MIASSNWLRSLVDLEDIDNDKLGEILTSLGLEVEGTQEFSTVKGGLDGIVIGKVLTCEPHPDADRLKVTTVNIGDDNIKQIVCGAPNVAAGQTVPVATLGSTIYTDDGSFQIKKSKIRGVESEGMICAEDELGLGESHDGIMVLPDYLEAGMEAKDYFEVEQDFLFDIGLTPNRSDATHHIGIAKDLAAYITHKSEKAVAVNIPGAKWPIKAKDLDFTIDVVNQEGAPRYAGVLITDLTINESPKWMQNRLRSLGLKPKNNVIDVTNYVMHEMGQPLHAFDIRNIEGNGIKVQKLAKGTSFTTLDEVTRTLDGEELMICDAHDNPLCMAGVFGGLNSGVKSDTRTIFLESAHFNPKMIRNASMKHQLRTDAAKIFEKGSDPSIVLDALKRASYLLHEIAGGRLASEPVDIYPLKVENKHVNLRFQRVRDLIGIEITNDAIIDILKSLNMLIISESKEGVLVSVPLDKADVLREVDIIEEILRIYGFDTVEVKGSVSSFLNPINIPEKQSIIHGLKSRLIGQGFQEMMNVSLTNSEYFSDDQELIYINNTSNKGLNVLRPSLMTSALETARHNINRNQRNLRLFEIGKSYEIETEKYKETDFLSLLITGLRNEKHWTNSENSEVNIFDLKSYVNFIFDSVKLSGYQVEKLENTDNYLYGLRYHRGPKTIAKFGMVHPDFASKHDVKDSIFFAEIDMKTILQAAKKGDDFYTEINKFPSVHRELSLLIEEGIPFANIEKTITKASSKELKQINVLNIYKDEEKLGDKRSVSIELIFENSEKTLTDKYVNKQTDKIIKILRDKLSIELR